MTVRTTVSVDELLEVVLLAIRRAPLGKTLSPPDARTAVAPVVPSLLKGQLCDLEALWAVLRGLPGFHRERAAPALCYLKSIEGRLGVPVLLPTELRGLSLAERTVLGSLCPVRVDELEGAVADAGRADLPAAPATSDRGRDEALAAAVAAADADGQNVPRRSAGGGAGAALTGRRRAVFLASIAVTVLSLGVVGVTTLRGCGAATRPFDLAAATDLPVSGGRRLGNQAVARLADPSWQGQPEGLRRDQLAAALRGLEAHEVRVLVLEDADGRVVATAQWMGATPTVVLY